MTTLCEFENRICVKRGLGEDERRLSAPLSPSRSAVFSALAAFGLWAVLAVYSKAIAHLGSDLAVTQRVVWTIRARSGRASSTWGWARGTTAPKPEDQTGPPRTAALPSPPRPGGGSPGRTQEG